MAHTVACSSMPDARISARSGPGEPAGRPPHCLAPAGARQPLTPQRASQAAGSRALTCDQSATLIRAARP